MKKILKKTVLLLLLLAAVTFTSVAVTATAPQRYDVANEGILSDYYPVDQEKGWITGIPVNTPLHKVLNVCTPAGVTADSEILTTGTVLTAQYETVLGPASAQLTVIVTGDVNGDGGITITDMLMLKSCLLGELLSAEEAAAGDLTFDGQITITDFLKIKSYLLGLETIPVAPATEPSRLFLLQTGTTEQWNGGVENIAAYESSDPSVVTVENGLLTGLQGGTAFVYALDGEGNVLARQMITVLDEPVAIALESDTLQLTLGQTHTLIPVFNHPVQPGVQWESSDAAVVTVENGVLTTQSFGTATVTATLLNGSSAQISVTVAPPITQLNIEKSLYKVKPEHSRPLGLFLEPGDTGEEIIWTSSDPSIATVDAQGNVTGVNYGTVTVTATGKYSGLSDSCEVKVCDVIQVALTFDDGPSKHTVRLLDCLKENEVKVTFFLVANRISTFPTAVQREAAEGHEIGYHSYAHANQPSLSSSQITNDYLKSDKILYNLTGQHFTVWRTPGGSYNSRVLACVELPHIMWSGDTADWKTRNETAVYNAILRLSKDGAIILMHDLHGFTVDGAIRAIEEMVEGDYEFLTVTEMLSRDGTPPENGKTYYSGK